MPSLHRDSSAGRTFAVDHTAGHSLVGGSQGIEDAFAAFAASSAFAVAKPASSYPACWPADTFAAFLACRSAAFLGAGESWPGEGSPCRSQSNPGCSLPSTAFAVASPAQLDVLLHPPLPLQLQSELQPLLWHHLSSRNLS